MDLKVLGLITGNAVKKDEPKKDLYRSCKSSMTYDLF